MLAWVGVGVGPCSRYPVTLALALILTPTLTLTLTLTLTPSRACLALARDGGERERAQLLHEGRVLEVREALLVRVRARARVKARARVRARVRVRVRVRVDECLRCERLSLVTRAVSSVSVPSQRGLAALRMNAVLFCCPTSIFRSTRSARPSRLRTVTWVAVRLMGRVRVRDRVRVRVRVRVRSTLRLRLRPRLGVGVRLRAASPARPCCPRRSVCALPSWPTPGHAPSRGPSR